VPHPRLGGVEALAKKAMLQQGYDYDVKTTTSYDKYYFGFGTY
jgi:hypothetical protein